MTPETRIDLSGRGGRTTAPPLGRPRLTFDLDVDLCVIGGGLAGLSVAREAARLGATVAILEAREVAWGASGHNLGTVMPGFGVEVADIVARVGRDHARELWKLSEEGVGCVSATVDELQIPAAGQAGGALEVSNTDHGDRLLARLQILSSDFGADVEGWQTDRVRETLRTARYFHAIHFPKAFHVDALNYARGLASLGEQAGVRIFEQTPVVSIDPSGIRKRIVTPSGNLRASFIVLAGNVHLGAPLPRLSGTLLPVWRYMALTAPLGASLQDVISYQGSVNDGFGIDQYRIVDGDRLLWSGPVTTWEADPVGFRKRFARRIRTVFPQLGPVPITDVWSGVTGETVHGMPQIGQLRRGLWVASGFGRQGLNTAAMAGRLIAGGMLSGDDRWKLFAPFELVWTGGAVGRVVGQAVYSWSRGQAAGVGAVARYRERAKLREHRRETRLAAANLAVKTMQTGIQGSRPRLPSAKEPAVVADLQTASRESETGVGERA